jgi:hypothetical protein
MPGSYGETRVGNSLSTLVEDFPQEVNFDEFGVATGAMFYTTQFDLARNLVAQKKEHPDYDFMIRKSATIRREEAGQAAVVIGYFGIENDLRESFFHVTTSTNLEPIETHPKWVSDIGGSGSSADMSKAKNGALFDRQGQFIGFKPFVKDFAGSNVKNKFGGIRSYHSPTVMMEEMAMVGKNRMADFLKVFGRVGRIEDPTGSNYMPDVGPNQTYLYVGIDIQQIGKGARVTRKHKLSGVDGWNTLIYTDERYTGSPSQQ